MDYYQAFDKLIKTYGLKMLNDSFLVRSFLYDNIGNSYTDIDLLNAYYLLDKDNHIYNQIKGYQLDDSKTYIKSLIRVADKRYSVPQYIKSVEPLLMFLYPTQYVRYKEPSNMTPAKVIKNNNNKKRKAAVIVNNNQAPVKQQRVRIAKKPIDKYEEVNIDVQCRKLIVIYDQYQEPRLYTKDFIDISKNGALSIKNGSINLSLRSRAKTYTLLLPRKQFKKMDITFNGADFVMGGPIKANNVVVNSKKGRLELDVEADNLTVYQGIGNMVIGEKIKHLLVTAYEGNVTCSFDGDIINDCSINVGSGYMNLFFSGYTIKPRIPNLFHRLKEVNRVCKLGKRDVKLSLKVQNKGRIHIR